MPEVTGLYKMESWNEELLRDAPPPGKCSVAKVHGTVSGAVQGKGETFYLTANVTEHDGPFTGYTYFDVTINGRTGGFLMADAGSFDAESATTKWTIVEGSGTGDFTGVTGTGGFRATHGMEVEFTLSYEI